MEITKAIIPIAGLGTRFLPLSKVVSKELWPLVDRPVIQYIIEEAKDSGISEIIFVISPEKKVVLKYFQPSPQIEKILKDRKKDHLLSELKNLEGLSKDISFSSVFQKKPLGAAHAVLQAEKLIKNESCAVLWADDVVESETPCLLQLSKIFKTCQKPVIALYRLPREKLPSYGIVEVEKITSRLYKIKRVAEKPSVEQAPSDLAIVGKYIITPEVFDCLKKTPFNKKKDISLSETLGDMAKDGKMIYGYEFEGKWLECGNKSAWLESNFYLSLKHPQFGTRLKKYLKEIR